MRKEGEAKTIKDTGLLREPLLDCTNRQNVGKRDSGSVMKKKYKGAIETDGKNTECTKESV